jgi:hypothetical protein
MSAAAEAPEAKWHWIGQCMEIWGYHDTSIACVMHELSSREAKQKAEAAAAAAATTAASGSAGGVTLSEQQLLDIERNKVAALQRKLEMMEEKAGRSP